MTSTNYYVVHKTGRKLKVSCIGFMHDEKMRKAMVKKIAELEHGRVQDYKLEAEQTIEQIKTGRKATQADYKEFTFQ